MAKKFDIHEWQAKQRLAEQEEFTPDLEDDDLKRSKIQQMMAKEKESEYKLSDQEKDSLHDMVIEFTKQLTDPDKGNYLGDRLLAALQFIILEIENLEPMLYHDLATGYDEELNEVDIKRVVDQSMNNDDIGKLQDVIRNNNLGKILNTIAVILDRTGDAPEGAAQMIADLVAEIPEGDEEEIDEQNVTGTGASFTTGNSPAYATPKAFGKKKKKDVEVLGYKLVNEENEEPQASEEEEISKDVEKIENLPALDRVNTREEWEDLMQVVLDMGDEIRTVTPAAIKIFLTQALKSVNQPK